jgi:hypothetical protein
MLTDDMDLFEMANLYPRTTDARVKVNTAHRPSMDKAG